MTTKIPSQLIDPTGSTSGQVLQSTGPSTPPGFAALSVANVAGAAPLASPAFTGTPSVPNVALNTNTTQAVNAGYIAGTLEAPPAIGNGTPGAISATTISATGLITPLSTIGIKGTVTNDSPAAGSIGELLTASTGSATGITSATPQNVVSINLQPGDYDITCQVQFIAAGSTVPSLYAVGVNTVSATRPGYAQEALLQATFGAGSAQQIASPVAHIKLAAAATVYGVALASFSTSTMTVSGTISARRVR